LAVLGLKYFQRVHAALFNAPLGRLT
jgi:hypothetical protein